MGNPGRPKAKLVLANDERTGLQRLVRRRKTSNGLAQRARIVLECACSATNGEVAKRVGVNEKTVGKWRKRFVDKRLEGLFDEPQPGAPRKLIDDDVERVIVKTLEEMAIGRADELGTIEVGKRADLIVLGAPTYHHVVYHYGVNPVHHVVKSGKVVVSDGDRMV